MEEEHGPPRRPRRRPQVDDGAGAGRGGEADGEGAQARGEEPVPEEAVARGREAEEGARSPPPRMLHGRRRWQPRRRRLSWDRSHDWRSPARGDAPAIADRLQWPVAVGWAGQGRRGSMAGRPGFKWRCYFCRAEGSIRC